MKKKVAASVKHSSSKLKKIKHIRSTKPMSRKPPPVSPSRPSFPQDPSFTQAVQNYETGLKAMQEHKFDKAKALLEKIIANGPKELSDRARVHLSTCNQQLANSTTSFKSAEEHFDYAVSLMNSGQYEQSRSHMEKILKQNSKADFVYYGLALLDCLTNRSEDCLRNLNDAIKLNVSNRFQARNDPDFKNMADDPRFTELLYPEVPPESGR